jgi:hypothetical protein
VAEEGRRRQSKFMAWAEGRSAEETAGNEERQGTKPQPEQKVQPARSVAPSDLRGAFLALASFALASATGAYLVSNGLLLTSTSQLSSLQIIGIVVEVFGFGILTGGFVAAGEAFRTREGADRREGLRDGAKFLLVGALVQAFGATLILIGFLTGPNAGLESTAEIVGPSIVIASWLLAAFASYAALEYFGGHDKAQALFRPDHGLALAAGALSVSYALDALERVASFQSTEFLATLTLNSVGLTLQVFGYFTVSVGLAAALAGFSVLWKKLEDQRNRVIRWASLVVSSGFFIAALGLLGRVVFFDNESNALSYIASITFEALASLLLATAAASVAAGFVGQRVSKSGS